MALTNFSSVDTVGNDFPAVFWPLLNQLMETVKVKHVF